MALRVLAVCAVKLYREGLARVLTGDPRIGQVRTAGDPFDAIRESESLRPDVALIDAVSVDPLEAVPLLRDALRGTPLVAIAVPDRERDIIIWAEAGVEGLVPPDAAAEELIACMESASKQELRCSARVAGALLRRIRSLATSPRPVDPIATLTPRESHLLELLGRGMSNKEIARTLEIELSTVKNHVHNILEKLRVRRRGEAVALLHRSQA